MTAAVSLGTALTLLGGFLLFFVVMLIVVEAELHRPLTPQEQEARDAEERADAWEGFVQAKRKSRLAEELHRKELADVACIHAEHRAERVISRKEVA